MMMALFVTMSVAALTVVVLQMGVSFNREVGSGIEDERALLLAEAGLAESLFALRRGESGRIGTADTPARRAEGVFWVEVEDVGNDLKRLQSSAMIGAGRAALQQLVFEYSDPLFTTALFSNRGMSIESQAMVDSFDSAFGPYSAQLAALGGSHIDSGAVVASNGDISVDSSVEIWGDVHAGTDSSLTVRSSGNVAGTTENLSSYRPLAEVDEPLVPKILNWTVPNTRTLKSGVYGFNRLDIDTGGKLTVEGPATLVMTDFRLRSNSELVLDTTNGPIQLYVSGKVDLNSNSTIVTPTQAADQVTLYLTGSSSQKATLNSNSKFYGLIYGPKATVDIRSNFEVFGSVVADELIVNSNTKVHFDEQLRNKAGPPLEYEASAWSQVGFPVREFLIDRRDPFQLLGVAPADLPLPGDAHDL